MVRSDDIRHLQEIEDNLYIVQHAEEKKTKKIARTMMGVGKKIDQFRKLSRTSR